jgi:Arc/MetJ family transcription regulator
MLFANDTLICTIAELIRCSPTRIDTDSDLIIRVLRAIALTVGKVLSPSALDAIDASALLDLIR